MTDEEYFRKTYPDSCYGDRPLSPYWDLFQDGTEFGERQSENKIEELIKENAELKADNDARKFAMAMSEKVEKQLREQLSKATEIIREIMKFDIPTLDYEQAEQFLKEIEKWHN